MPEYKADDEIAIENRDPVAPPGATKTKRLSQTEADLMNAAAQAERPLRWMCCDCERIETAPVTLRGGLVGALCSVCNDTVEPIHDDLDIYKMGRDVGREAAEAEINVAAESALSGGRLLVSFDVAHSEWVVERDAHEEISDDERWKPRFTEALKAAAKEKPNV